jgi:outer membrane protein insertion porin family
MAQAGLLLLPRRGECQLPASLLDEETEVHSIRVRFVDSKSFREDDLLDRIALSAQRGSDRLARSVAFLPFVSEPPMRGFDPLELQRDVVRIREFYRENGFPEAEVRYEVSMEEGRNRVDVEFLITEGRPRILVSVAYLTPDGAPVEDVLPAEITPAWRRLLHELNSHLGKRLGVPVRREVEGAPIRWLMDRGYPSPTADGELELDPTGLRAGLKVRIDPGMRGRVASVNVLGLESVDETAVLREVPIRVGDWFAAGRVRDGRQRIASLAIIRAVTAEVVPAEGHPSGVSVLYRVREARPRSLSGFVGYSTVGGLSLGAEWEHRNVGGRARTLLVSGTGETGILGGLAGSTDRYLRGAISLRQPFLFVSGLSLVASPFGEYRDDYRDRSWEAGIDATLVYQIGPLRAVSLRARVAKRGVLEYRVGEGDFRMAGIPDIGEVVDSLADHMVVSAFTLSGTLERLDDPVDPRQGFVLQPSLEITAPLGFPTNEYFKAELWGSLFHTLRSRIGVAANLRAGRVFPFGNSVPPAESDGLLQILQLRDVNLTSGGPLDVRGWASRLLGPKVPEVEAGSGEPAAPSASRYLPLGGLARISGGVEVRFPFPVLASGLEGHLFLDGGRVWSPDDRYPQLSGSFAQSGGYASTGGGLGIGTPVGPIRITVGYKLNPSPLDLRDPGEVLALYLAGESILDAKPRNSRRFQFHLTVGRAF